MTKMKYISIWMVGCMLLSLGAKAQQVVKLDLQRTIEIANDSSLSAFRYQNLYLSGYWEYRTYKANRLPSLTLDLTRLNIIAISPSVMIRMRIWMYIVNNRCSAHRVD